MQRHVCCDSRLVGAGDVFVAIPGVNADGMSFVSGAIERGASEIVAEVPRPDTGVPESVKWRMVPDARAEAARLACVEFGDPSDKLAVFGITGTNGKTTTATLVRRILNDNACPAGFISTICNITSPPRKRTALDQIKRRAAVEQNVTPAVNTTPGPIELQKLFAEMLTNGCKAVAMEVSSHALDQHRVEGTRFAMVAFTNLTQDHLDYHKTMDGYYQAKRKLFIPLRAPEVINIDDPYGRRLYGELLQEGASNILTYGSSEDAQVRFSDAELSLEGSSFLLSFPGGSEHMHLKLIGRHNIYNALAAFSMTFLYGISPHKAILSLSAAEPVRGRLERVKTKISSATFFVDYAHTPDALENVLKTLREATTGRIFAVFGAGGDRDRTKRSIMGAAVMNLADVCIVTSDNPRKEDPSQIITDILAGMPGHEKEYTPDGTRRVIVEPDRRAAISLSAGLATRPDDIVLIAGKGHETYQIFADRTEHFDDREEILSL